MDPEIAVDTGRQAIQITLMLATPVLLIAMAIGIVMGIVQAITQIQDYTLSVAPKIIILLIVIALGLPWLMGLMTEYARELFTNIPQVISQG
jgi:flagellar biosynthetic protein FliQ